MFTEKELIVLENLVSFKILDDEKMRENANEKLLEWLNEATGRNKEILKKIKKLKREVTRKEKEDK